MLKISLACGLCAILFAYYNPYFVSFVKDQLVDVHEVNIKNEIVKSWKHIIRRPIRDKKMRISIGLNTNVDLILPAVDLLKRFNLNSFLKPHDHPIINSLEELQNTFAFFFNKGHAAERFVSNREDFDKIIDYSLEMPQQWFIGGNAALMAHSISKRFQDTEIMLIGPIGPKLKSLLNEKILIPSETVIEKDEIHLIIEYKVNEQFNGLVAPTANRFIVSHDISNSKMEMLDKFFELTVQYKPDLVILAGLHLLESQTDEFKSQKLKSLKSYLDSVDKSTAVHLELASIGDKTLMNMILENGIFDSVNSIGLNEQELLFASYAANGPHSNYFKEIDGVPDLRKVVDIIEWVLLTHGKNSKLTRVHFHYLLYHIIAINDDNAWSNTESALLSGTKIASKQACDYDFDADENDDFHSKIHYRINTKQFQIDENQYIEIDPTNPVMRFQRNNIKFYLTPVLVCKKPIKTVGLGDAISSTGLLFSHFKAHEKSS